MSTTDRAKQTQPGIGVLPPSDEELDRWYESLRREGLGMTFATEKEVHVLPERRPDQDTLRQAYFVWNDPRYHHDNGKKRHELFHMLGGAHD